MSDAEQLSQFARLARAVAAAPDEVARLQVAVDRTVSLVHDCDHAGFTVNEKGGLLTRVSSDDLVRRADALQQELGEGPCRDVLRDQDALVSGNLAGDRRWPTWATQVHRELHLRSVMSVLVFTDEHVFGVLTLYALEGHRFDADDLAVGQALADQLSVVLAGREADRSAGPRVEQPNPDRPGTRSADGAAGNRGGSSIRLPASSVVALQPQARRCRRGDRAHAQDPGRRLCASHPHGSAAMSPVAPRATGVDTRSGSSGPHQSDRRSTPRLHGDHELVPATTRPWGRADVRPAPEALGAPPHLGCPREATGEAADPAPERRDAAAGPARPRARARRDHHGRQRPLGEGAWAAPHEGARAGRAHALRRRRGRDRDRREGHLGLRVLHRELVALARRGALPDGLQPRRDPPPSRRDARPRRTRALGRSRSSAVEVGHQGAPGRRGDDEGQRRPHPHDVRQLRRPGRARRRRPRHRPRGRRGPSQPGQDRRARLRPPPLRPRAAGRRPGLAHVGGAAAVQLHAVAGGLQRAGLHRRALARRRPAAPVVGRRDVRQPRPPLRRRHPQPDPRPDPDGPPTRPSGRPGRSRRSPACG